MRIKPSTGTVTIEGNLAVTGTAPGGGSGDVTGPAASIDSEIAIFSSTTGKIIKRATTTGILKASSGVLSAAVAGTDYAAASHTHAASDISSGTIATARLGSGTANSSTFLRGDNTWATPAGGAGVSGSVSIAFTDGDTARRVTVTDANVSSTSKIIGTVRRPNATEVADTGFVYTANVISQGTGTFDLFVLCADWGDEDPVGDPPNETITFNYTVM